MKISPRLLGLLLSSFSVFSYAESIKLPHIEAFENLIKVKGSLLLKTEENHHFNAKSPLNCGEGASAKIENSQLTCSYPKAGSYKLFLAVCDDGNKYCKIFRPEISVGNVASPKILSDKNKSPVPQKQKIEHGFKLGQPESTLDAVLQANSIPQAKGKKPKSILMDFFALWCPPCNDLDELVFSSKIFQKEAKNLEKIKINVDEEESWKLKEKFKILGYPTLIYLNTKGEEVGRYWGTQSPELMVLWLKKMQSLETMPISWAANQSDAENVKRTVEWNYDLANYQIVKNLTGARSEEWAHKFFFRSDATLAADAKDTKTQVKSLNMLTMLFPTDILYPSWVLDLANIDKKNAEKLLPQAVSTLDSWLARPEDALKENFSAQDLVLLKAELFEAFERKEELKSAQLDAIKFLEKSLKGGKVISRGRSHILAYYYRETGRVEDAKKIYEKLVKATPQEFTFYIRYARALKDLKEFEKSLEWLEKGAPYMTEGNSRLQYAWLRGDLLNKLGKKDEALQIVEGTLAIAKAPDWEKNSTNRLIKELVALKSEITAEEKKKQ